MCKENLQNQNIDQNHVNKDEHAQDWNYEFPYVSITGELKPDTNIITNEETFQYFLDIEGMGEVKNPALSESTHDNSENSWRRVVDLAG